MYVCICIRALEGRFFVWKSIEWHGIQIMFNYSLKGQCHEIFELYFFPLNEPIWAPDKQAKMVFLKNSCLRRYSNFSPS